MYRHFLSKQISFILFLKNNAYILIIILCNLIFSYLTSTFISLWCFINHLNIKDNSSSNYIFFALYKFITLHLNIYQTIQMHKTVRYITRFFRCNFFVLRVLNFPNCLSSLCILEKSAIYIFIYIYWNHI